MVLHMESGWVDAFTCPMIPQQLVGIIIIVIIVIAGHNRWLVCLTIIRVIIIFPTIITGRWLRKIAPALALMSISSFFKQALDESSFLCYEKITHPCLLRLDCSYAPVVLGLIGVIAMVDIITKLEAAMAQIVKNPLSLISSWVPSMRNVIIMSERVEPEAAGV